jgi:hypothetical protein
LPPTALQSTYEDGWEEYNRAEYGVEEQEPATAESQSKLERFAINSMSLGTFLDLPGYVTDALAPSRKHWTLLVDVCEYVPVFHELPEDLDAEEPAPEVGLDCPTAVVVALAVRCTVHQLCVHSQATQVPAACLPLVLVGPRGRNLVYLRGRGCSDLSTACSSRTGT